MKFHDNRQSVLLPTCLRDFHPRDFNPRDSNPIWIACWLFLAHNILGTGPASIRTQEANS